MQKFLSFFAGWLLSSSLLHAQAWKGDLHPDLPALRKQAEGGDPTAMADYAFHSMRCMGGLEYQPDLIFDYFTRSAAAGNIEGQVGLAHCYCFSVGTVRNLQKVAQLIEGPFKTEHPVAQKLMGHLHYGSQEVRPRDLEKVREFNRKAAAQGCIAAQYNIALGYCHGAPELNVKKGMNELRRMHEGRVFVMASGHLLEVMDQHRIWDDHDEVYRSCIQRISEYAELREPYALYRLGVFHHNAGDFESAVGCYTQAAHLGNGSAWFELWRIIYFGQESNEVGNVWSTLQDRGNVAMRAYERGRHNNSSLVGAGWEITRRSWQPGYQEMLPQLEKDSLAALNSGSCSQHDILARIYFRADKKKNPQLAKPEWGWAHLTAHCHHGSDSLSEMAYRYLKGPKTTDNLARGLVCAMRARAKGNSAWSEKSRWEWVDSLVTPEARELAKELGEDEFPEGEKHRKKAVQFLRKLGHLNPASGE